VRDIIEQGGVKMTKTAKITYNGKALEDCPKCKAEDSLFVSGVLKWGKISKWQYAVMCNACNYERKAK
jgi:hypothetical protein